MVKPIRFLGEGAINAAPCDQIDAAWEYAQEGGRAGKGAVIVEGFVEFDYEITLLTVRHAQGTLFVRRSGMCKWMGIIGNPGSRSP